MPAVFTSVSKGQVARAFDLENSFGEKTPLGDIILEILNKGELQVGEKERQAQLERVHNEVMDLVAGKLVDPRTKRVYTTGMIEKALAELSTLRSQAQPEGKSGAGAEDSAGVEQRRVETKDMPSWTGVVTTRSAKSQALDAMKALIAHQPIPVARARMRLRITCPANLLKQSVKSAPKSKDVDAESQAAEGKGTVKDKILSFVEQVEVQDVTGQDWEVVGFVEPGAFKGLSEFIGGETKGRGRIEVLDMAVVHEDD